MQEQEKLSEFRIHRKPPPLQCCLNRRNSKQCFVNRWDAYSTSTVPIQKTQRDFFWPKISLPGLELGSFLTELVTGSVEPIIDEGIFVRIYVNPSIAWEKWAIWLSLKLDSIFMQHKESVGNNITWNFVLLLGINPPNRIKNTVSTSVRIRSKIQL